MRKESPGKVFAMNKASSLGVPPRLAVTYRAVSDLIPDPRNARTHPKRQIDQLHHESDSAKSKSQELFGQYKEKQDTIRRVVRALRIALTILEGDDETVVPFKKAE